MGVASVLGTKLAVRVGTKLIVTTGLVMVAGFYAWVPTVVGEHGLRARSPRRWCSTASAWVSRARPRPRRSWASCPREKAGVGSAVNDATRLLGGTLGVAVIGSVYASLYASRLTCTLPARLPARPRRTRPTPRSGAALGVAEGLLGLRTSPPSLRASRTLPPRRFVHGLSVGCLVAGGVAAAGAVMAGVLLPAWPQETARADDGAVARVRARPAPATAD